eukprot:m.99684 g.99684  ORF g.99684 m.99684 type:complete len:569 (+) comp27179_c0_seq3:112-1818(+)
MLSWGAVIGMFMATHVATSTLTLRPVNDMTFVTREGSQLLWDGKPTRFSGPNVYWMALDENVIVNGSKVAYPTHFRVDDVFAIAEEMGANVIRAHTVGVSTGNPKSFEPKLNVFNDKMEQGNDTSSASEHIDYAIYRARQTGIRLLVPLTDNYAYYHGGKHDFVDWIDPNMPYRENCVLPLSVKEPEASLCPFYTNVTVITAFKDYIAALLNHTNQYTGVQLKNEPAIIGWETGNELNGVKAAWSQDIASFIRNTAGAKQLVFDGIDSERLGGVANLDSEEVDAEDIDCYTDHFYPPNPGMAINSAKAAVAANKVYYVGEYDWRESELSTFLTTIETTVGINGALFWSLFPHDDDHGYVEHGDGLTLHWPGDTPNMKNAAQQLRAHAYKIRGLPIPPFSTPSTSPVITSVSGALLAWRGVAVANNYTIQRGTTSTGPWSVICDECASDLDTPWTDPTRSTADVYYRVKGIGLNGESGPWSLPVFSKYKPQPPPPKCAFQNGRDWNPNGPGSKEAHAVSADDCCSQCGAYALCEFAAYNTADGGCWMKPKGSTPVSKPDTIIGCTPNIN